jgi:hypothetical protein
MSSINHQRGPHSGHKYDQYLKNFQVGSLFNDAFSELDYSVDDDK